jgi:5'-phosphate synthase pdxT subunit
MQIAVIAIQGNVSEHIQSIQKALAETTIKADVIPVQHSNIISSCDALILPGGESTTLGRLMEREGIDTEIKQAAANGIPVMGTCAGLVLLAKEGGEQSKRTGQKLLGLMDISVDRNVFGRQRESFEILLTMSILQSPYNAVFIRAPAVTRIGPYVEVLARFKDHIVAVQQNNILGLAFHPELTNDIRIHRYFLTFLQESG